MVILEKSGAVPRWDRCFQVGVAGWKIARFRTSARPRGGPAAPLAPGQNSRRNARSRRQCSRHASGAGWTAAFSSWRARTLWAVCQAPQRGPVLRRAGGIALPYVGPELLQAAGAVGLEQKLVARKVGGNGLRLIVGRFIGQRGACGRRIGRGLGHQRQRIGHAGFQFSHRCGLGHHAPHRHGLQLFAHGGAGLR